MAKAKVKTTKSRVSLGVKPMEEDPMCVTLQKHGPKVVTDMIKPERLEEQHPEAFRKELKKWMRDNNRVKSAR